MVLTIVNSKLKQKPKSNKPKPNKPKIQRRRVVNVLTRRSLNKLRRIRRRINRSNYYTPRGGPRMITPRRRLTTDGLAFLKCAFAPPDFLDTQVKGIPDNYRGQTLLKRHRTTVSFTCSSGTDYYILLLPTPGIAYWTATAPAGALLTNTVVFTAVPYSDCQALFGNENTASDIINRYRMVSNHFEMISTTNDMTYSGTINCFKFNPQLLVRQGTEVYSITGLQSVNSTLIPMLSNSTKQGVFAGAYCTEADFPFEPILENITAATIPYTPTTADWGQLNAAGLGVLPGFYSHMEALCIRITGVTSSNTFILKTWACVEYIPQATSTLNDYTSASPAVDPIALKAYREIILGLPIAVKAEDNANFWQRVLTILRAITGAGSNLPGAYGMMSSGANAIIGGIQDLTL